MSGLRITSMPTHATDLANRNFPYDDIAGNPTLTLIWNAPIRFYSIPVPLCTTFTKVSEI